MSHLSRFLALKGQSELSFAVSAMFLSGGLFAGLAATVFPPEHAPPVWVLILVSGTGLIVCGLVLWRGLRLKTTTAAVIIGLYWVFLLFLSAHSTTLARATVISMLSVVVIVLYALYLPMKYARLISYVALLLLAVVLVFRYQSNDAYLTAVALVSLAALLIEVFARFRADLEKSSLTDHLCGVWNRRGFDMLLDKEIGAVSRTGEPLSLIFLDLDGFKCVNDSRGHLQGDIVLQQVSAELEVGVRSGDSVARIGGDEFVVLLPRTNEDEAQLLAHRLRGLVTACVWSHGIAEYRAGESSIEFIARSDVMMMREKRERERSLNLARKVRSVADDIDQSAPGLA